MRVLKLRGNKLQHPYSTWDLTAVNPFGNIFFLHMAIALKRIKYAHQDKKQELKTREPKKLSIKLVLQNYTSIVLCNQAIYIIYLSANFVFYQHYHHHYIMFPFIYQVRIFTIQSQITIQLQHHYGFKCL